MLTFTGKPYNRQTLETIDNNDEDEDDDSDEENGEGSYDEIFYLGR